MKLRTMLTILRIVAVLVLVFYFISRAFLWLLVAIVLFLLERMLWRTIAQCRHCNYTMPSWDGYKHTTCPKCGNSFTYHT